MATNRRNISAVDVERVSEKVQALHETSSPGEQAVVEAILKGFEASLRDGRSLEDLLADVPEKDDLLDDVAGFSLGSTNPNVPVIISFTTPLISNCCPEPE